MIDSPKRSNYIIYRGDRNAPGGGILIAVEDSLPSTHFYTSDS